MRFIEKGFSYELKYGHQERKGKRETEDRETAVGKGQYTSNTYM